MKKLGTHPRYYLRWHRKIHAHPLFNASFARENLVSLAATFVMLYLYTVIFILAFHFIIVLGYLETETILWLIIETNARNLMFGLPDAYFLNQFFVFGIFLVTVGVTIIIRLSFDVLKANLHPDSQKLFQKYTKALKGVKIDSKSIRRKQSPKYVTQNPLALYAKKKLTAYRRRVAYYKKLELQNKA